MRKYLVEFIGTFFLVLTIVLSVNGTTGLLAPLAIGLGLMAFVYAGGHISGAHYNPVVTLMFWVQGTCRAHHITGYIIAQILGGIAAATLGSFLLGHVSEAVGISTLGRIDPLAGILAELLGTFALCYVILNVAVARGTEGNMYYGLAIGLVVTAGIYMFGGISGAVFNPAVAFSLASLGMIGWSDIWILLVGQFIGGGLAVVVFNFVADPLSA